MFMSNLVVKRKLKKATNVELGAVLRSRIVMIRQQEDLDQKQVLRDLSSN
jgi:hypothetical protein